MTEVYYACECGFKCVEHQLGKTQGACPRCGARRASMRDKYGEGAVERTNIHITSRGGV